MGAPYDREGLVTFRLTQRMAAASSRRPRRTLAIWGLLVLVALVLATTSLKGLTTTAQVVGTTQSSQAEALYNQVVGSASHKPTDVIVVSSKNSTTSDQDFKQTVMNDKSAVVAHTYMADSLKSKLG